jgi:hypothetical protein
VSWVEGPSSEAEPYARCWGPRPRRELARGGAEPSSEAEFSWCSACPLSETEVRSRGVGTGRLLGH